MKGSELDMKYSPEEILNALHIIQGTCKEFDDVNEDDCPFYAEDGCMVMIRPDGWKINDGTPRVWKGLL